MPRTLVIFSLLLLTSWPTPAAAQQHANVTLIAEKASLVPGQPVVLGVHFEIDPHWHIYWQNPGDSGGPPAIDWKLPEGFQATAFEWPIPQRISIGEGLVNYGYEVDVLLPLTLRVPASAKPGTHAEIAGRVRYMICSELCVPARADVHLTLPIASSAAAATGAASSATTTLFAQTRARLPQPAPASWRAHATFASRQFDLTIDTGSSGSISGSAQFFPLIAGQINDAAAKPGQPAAHGLSFALPASDQLTAPPRTLKGIVVLSDTRAYTIDAPVTSPTR